MTPLHPTTATATATTTYCARCRDTGIVMQARLDAQPDALYCGCRLVNPIIKSRHEEFIRTRRTAKPAKRPTGQPGRRSP